MALWGGRFTAGPNDAVFNLSRSVHFDWRLAPYDLRSSMAHLQVLRANKIVNADVAESIQKALQELQREVIAGTFQPNAEDEDVHSALERGLLEKVGAQGGAIRAGRSRNDQVATDFKLYLIDHMIEISDQLVKLQSAIVDLAEKYVDVAAPGFTHLQHAQPVSFGHEIAKHAHSLARDISRIKDWLLRTNLSPLGAGALAGSALALDPIHTAKELGFSGVVANSIDAVSDRDFAAEALFIISLIGVHLSRIGEEWCLWSSTEFGYAVVDDAYATGSSIMPQKKNPDVAELARGKAGRFIGNLTGLLTVLKALPFAYNRDLQEDKESVFDSVENLLLVLPPLTGMVGTTRFNTERIEQSAPTGFSLATEVADFLVKQDVPFSVAHEIAGKCVQVCEANGIQLHELTDQQLSDIHIKLTPELREVLNVAGALAGRSTVNGTAPVSVKKQLQSLKEKLALDANWSSSERARFSGMMGQ